ncbi:MAG: cation diffusion facilitator family transporter [Vicinamibacterales bacterium]
MTAHAADLRIGRRLAVAGIAASATLAVVNITVGLIAHSTSVFATGVEFAGDVLASTMVLLGMIAAARPADANHPYGHGRVETLGAFVVGAILATGGAGICVTSFRTLGEVAPTPAPAALGVLVLAIAVRGAMSGLKFRVGRRLRSAALTADAWNDLMDLVSAVVALAAVGLSIASPVRFRAADHVGGIVVGLVVVTMGLRVLYDAALDLVDTMPAPDLIERLRVTALEVPGVLGVDKAYARKTGLRYHVDLHVEVAPGMTVGEAHEVAGRVRSRLRERLDWVADVLVHIEPLPEPAPPAA